jgi:hypothetical protein
MSTHRDLVVSVEGLPATTGELFSFPIPKHRRLVCPGRLCTILAQATLARRYAAINQKRLEEHTNGGFYKEERTHNSCQRSGSTYGNDPYRLDANEQRR